MKKYKVTFRDGSSVIVPNKQSVEDERLSPMTYKKLKEMGYTHEKWKNLTQEQANKIIQQRGTKQVSSKTTKQEQGKPNTNNELDIFSGVSFPNPNTAITEDLTRINSVAKKHLPFIETKYEEAQQASNKFNSDPEYQNLKRHDSYYLLPEQREELNRRDAESFRLNRKKFNLSMLRSAILKLSKASTSKEYKYAIYDYIYAEAKMIYDDILQNEEDDLEIKNQTRKARQNLIKKYSNLNSIAKKATNNTYYRSVMYY